VVIEGKARCGHVRNRLAERGESFWNDEATTLNVNILGKRRVFDGFFKIDELKLQFEKFNGEMSAPVARLIFERGDSVAAVILNTDTKRLIFTNQFKAPSYEKGPGWITEIVAGMIDGGESPLEALRREIFEETGYRVREARPLSTFYVSPGGSSERIFLYYVEVDNAEHEGRGGGVAAEGEDIQLIEMTISDALTAVSSGGFADAKTIVGVLSVQEVLSKYE
jgi:nudix-type nucleoside diphosphatase (YffH/AdpP family)